MLEITLILILVVVTMVAIIVNRRSLLACIVITAIASLLGLGFLILYANADKFASHEKLLSFTITFSAVIILILLAVTYIGVKMHFKKFSIFKKAVGAGTTTQEPVQERLGEAMLIPGTDVYAKPVGIFGRKAIDKPKTKAVQADRPAYTFLTASTKSATAAAGSPEPKPEAKVEAKVETVVPVQQKREEPKKIVSSLPVDATLKRMLDKAESFKEAKQYVLAEQMYVTYIKRCPDVSSRADGELLMLECRILAGNVDGSKEQLADLLGKLRSGEYLLSKEQKAMLAECKMNLMKLQQGK